MMTHIPALRMLVGAAAAAEFYSSKVLPSDWQFTQYPSAIYVSSTNKTIVSWCAVGVGGDKASQVAEFDHATNTWSRRYNAGNYTLADDDHGHPAICRDADGYLHIFYGSHDSEQHWSSTNSPDDITSWTQHAPMGGDQTYPHPVVIGSTIYLFLRNGDAFPNNATLSLRTCTPSGGTGTFSAQANIVDFGIAASGRVYPGVFQPSGTDVHMVCTRSDASDTQRSHVYYFVYKTATGAVENHDGSFSTASGSLPVDLTSANANYRIVDFGTDGGEVPVLEFDSSGDPHVGYIQGTDGGGYTLRHIKRTAGVWGSPTTLATITDQVPGTGTGQGFCDMHGLVPGASGTMQAWYQNAAGDKLRRVRSASGVWSAEETIVASTGNRLMGQQSVRNAHPDIRSIFCETAAYPSADATAVLGKRYAHGDSGLLTFGMPAAGSSDAQWPNVHIMLGFDHRDGSTQIVNESDSGLVITRQGNAQVDTAQSKFGGASLLLDGTGDFLQLAHNSLFSVSNGDFTVECWVRRNASKLQTICSKRPNLGATEFVFYIDASNRLLMQAFATSAVVNVTGTGTLSSTSTWYHCALSRQGTTWRMFLDGVLEGTATESSAPTGNTGVLYIGRSEGTNIARDFNGWIDEFRFTSGVARYTAAFTPPSAAFPRI